MNNNANTPPCPACLSVNTAVITTRAGVRIYGCEECELAFAETSDYRSVDTDPSFYHGIDINYHNQLLKAKNILPPRLKAYECILGRKVSSVLEVGCATGAYAPVFMEMGISYTGIELETEIAYKARQRTNANIIQGNFLDISLDRHYDVFFSSQVLEHIKEPKAFISKAAGHVPNGLIHIDVPNHDGLVSLYRKFLSSNQYGFIQPPYHMMAYNKKSLEKLLDNCNLDFKNVRPVSNNDPVWGQLVTSSSLANKIFFKISTLINKGSLLTAIATPKIV